MVAHELEPESSAEFWVGSFAPDYTNDTVKKDEIHLRGVPDRWAALDDLHGRIDRSNAFERGWFLHLFTDACWDGRLITEFKDWYQSIHGECDWFPAYRQEIGCITYHLYHHMPWAKSVWELIENAPLDEIETSLPITVSDNEWYRDRVARKHRESDPNQMFQFFSIDRIKSFAETTSKEYRDRYLQGCSAHRYTI
jgi:hypothetical protein